MIDTCLGVDPHEARSSPRGRCRVRDCHSLIFAGAVFATAGAADAEVWGLKKSASVFFAGDADAAALAAGLAAASVLAFRVRLAFGELAGDSAAAAVAGL